MRTPSTASPAVVLTTLNAKYIHASLGLRYLLANLGELRESTALREFTIARPVGEIVDDLLSTLDELNAASGREGALQIVGFGVYIWNVVQTTAVVRTLRAARPHVRIVLGGPEVSHETDGQEIVALADHIITGWGEASFPRLCRALIDGCRPPRDHRRRATAARPKSCCRTANTPTPTWRTACSTWKRHAAVLSAASFV
jgi:radical SAM superfamily enzyme YgiQ (UPF0313 family)